MSPGAEDYSRARTETEPGRASAPGSTLRFHQGETRVNGYGPDQGEKQDPSSHPDHEAWDPSGHPEHGRRTEHAEHHQHEHHHHHVLIEPEEDRWLWRRKIRENPRQLAVYRSFVGVLGLLLICLGFVSGPLPGPGGIPLILAGLAIWSSEFEWAHQLMQWFKAQLHRYRTWSPHWKIAFWAIFFGCCLLVGYGYLLVLGAPNWLPDSIAGAVEGLPGIG
jgi:uncharacterized protein (TIGR02611 family)